jgi:hypothetical protein
VLCTHILLLNVCLHGRVDVTGYIMYVWGSRGLTLAGCMDCVHLDLQRGADCLPAGRVHMWGRPMIIQAPSET